MGSKAVVLPRGDVRVVSGPLDGERLLPPDTTAWVVVSG
jgi:hypothetical protein